MNLWNVVEETLRAALHMKSSAKFNDILRYTVNYFFLRLFSVFPFHGYHRTLITLSRATAISLSWSIQDGNCSRRDFWESWRKKENFIWLKRGDECHLIKKNVKNKDSYRLPNHVCNDQASEHVPFLRDTVIRAPQTHTSHSALLCFTGTANNNISVLSESLLETSQNSDVIIPSGFIMRHTHTYVLLEQVWVHSLHKVQCKHQLIRL